MALAISLAFCLIIIMSIIVTIECTITTTPAIIMIEIDEVNGLNRMIRPAIKSMMPKTSNRPQLGIAFLEAIATLMISILDNIIQMPSAITKIVERTFGIAIKIMPSMIDNTLDMTPKNGV